MQEVAVVLKALLVVLLLTTINSQDVTMSAVSGDIKANDLPRQRLAAPKGDWTFCNYSCVAEPSTPIIKDNTQGVLEIVVKHRDISQVTTAMVQWMYKYMTATVQVSNRTSAKSLMFQLLHPVDHAKVAARPKPLAVNSEVDWIEIPASRCKVATSGANKDMWSCVAANGKDSRKGFVRSDSATLWQPLFHTKITTTVKQLDSAGYASFGSTSLLSGRHISYLSHKWEDVPGQGKLRVTTTIRVGLLQQGDSSDFAGPDDPVSSFVSVATINDNIKSAFLNGKGASAVTLPQAGFAMILHNIQEWQRLPAWLPAVYSLNKNSMP